MRARYTPNGLTRLGSSTDQYVFVMPTLAKMRKIGRASAVAGTGRRRGWC